MAIEVRGLEGFLAVADFGSFTKAAATLGMSQPTLTQHIQRLEDKLGFPLLERNSRRVILSSQGESFKEEAEVLIAAHERTWAFAKKLRGQAGKELRLGTAFITSEVPERSDLLDAFAASQSKIALHVYSAGQERVINAVSEGKLDAAIVIGTGVSATEFARRKQAPGLFPTNLRVISLGCRRLSVRIPSTILEGCPSRISVTELAGKQVVMIDTEQSPYLLEPLKTLLETSGVSIFYPYESRHALAVERYGYRHAMPAISLNWFDLPSEPAQSRLVEIAEFEEHSELAVLMRDPRSSPAKADFVAFCEFWADHLLTGQSLPRPTFLAQTTP